MMAILDRHADVPDDIFEIAAYLLPRSPSVADRFVDAVQTSMKDAAQRPTFGSLKAAINPKHLVLRSW